MFTDKEWERRARTNRRLASRKYGLRFATARKRRHCLSVLRAAHRLIKRLDGGTA